MSLAFPPVSQPVSQSRFAATQRIASPPPLPQLSPPAVLFGATHNPASHRIDDDIYGVFRMAPKNELHVHQSGSSSISFLKYSLRQAIKRGDIEQLPLFKPDGSHEEVVKFKDENGQPLTGAALRESMERALKWENLREYFRFQMELDNNKRYIPSHHLNETTADPAQHAESGNFNFDALRQDGLSAYRQTSVKINPFVKNDDAAYILAYEYARDMALENVRYTEYRVSPSGNNLGGNSYGGIEDVLSSVSQGFEDAKDALGKANHPLDYGVIVLFERQSRQGDPLDKVQRAVQLAKDTVRLKQEGKYNIVGVDLAGDEANNPVSDFAPAFEVIKEYNRNCKDPSQRLGITIHAGETETSSNADKSVTLRGWESVSEAVRVAASAETPVRIGHGLQVINSSPLLQQAFREYVENPTGWRQKYRASDIINSSPVLKEIIDKGVVLEMCPKSNLQTYGIHPEVCGSHPDRHKGIQAMGRLSEDAERDKYTAAAYAMHPAVFLSRLGVKVAISTDNRTISNSDTPNEFVKLFKYAGLTYQDFKRMVLDGFDGAFLFDDKKKDKLMADVSRGFRQLESNPEALKGIRKMGTQLTAYQKFLLLKEDLVSLLRETLELLRARVQEWTQLTA